MRGKKKASARRFTFRADLSYRSFVDVIASTEQEARTKFLNLKWASVQSAHPQPELVNGEITGLHSEEDA